jgi:RsiW-degrading membrane proteinase PrsW (M82 family)
MRGDWWRRTVAHPRLASCLLAVALFWSGLYAVQMLIDIARPHLLLGPVTRPGEPVVGLLAARWPTVVKVTFWAVVVSWVVSALAWCAAVGHRRLARAAAQGSTSALRLATALVLLLPFTIFPAWVVGGHPLVLLACVPSTAYGLWLVSRLQRYRRVPAGLLLGVFGWGALLATGAGGANNLWVHDYSASYFLSLHSGDPVRVAEEVNTAVFASAGLFEELGKGTAVLLVYLLLRRHIDDVVAGVVLGAAAGLGFNLVESVEFITASGHSAGFEYWIRQSVGLMGAHTAFAAMVGAGFGLARQMATRQARLTAITAGYLAAAGGHFANDALLRWWAQVEPRAFAAAHPVLDALLIQPLALILLQGPFVAGYLLLRRRGVREQAEGLARVLEAEAATSSGVVRPQEIQPLVNAARRLWLRVTTLRHFGLPAYRGLLALQRAQYDLAFQLWHHARGDQVFGEPDTLLRQRVLHARRNLVALLAPPAQQTVRLPA